MINGDVHFLQDGDTLRVVQGSGKAIINWNSFSIGSNEATIFMHPNSSGSTLNRVTGSASSMIDGMLSANGQIWIINPNGVIFGPGSVVDVNGLLASTLDVNDQDFLNGGSFSLYGNSSAPIINHGTIELHDGSTAILAAQRVENHGFIGGVDSQIFLVGGNDILVNSGPQGKMMVTGVYGDQGQVTNTGTLEGKNITLESANNNVYAMAIQNSGTVRANTVTREGGKVKLVNSGLAGVESTGTIDASGDFGGGEITIQTGGAVNVGGTLSAASSQGAGGEVSVLGSSVGIGSDAKLSAFGDTAGGKVALGYTPGNNVKTLGVTIGNGATVNAGSNVGDGGEVVVSSTGALVLGGKIAVSSAEALGGRTELNAGQILVLESGEVDASGGVSGGYVKLAAEGDLINDGTVLANGGTGAGGTIIAQGDMVALTGNALLEANGGSKGGEVYVGGGFGGSDASIQNSESSIVADTAKVTANATIGGDGGRVVVWSDGDTLANGIFEAKGAGDNGVGGLVELSGLDNLQISGNVDTSGPGGTGTLLLDPININLGGAGISAASVMTALNTSNVVIHTAAVTGTDPGQTGTVNIARDFDMVYSSPNSFTILAHGDINVGTGGAANELLIINRGEGNITMVAGWEGLNAFTQNQQDSTSVPITAQNILDGDFGYWGQGGSINVNYDNAHRVEIGSAGGETNLFGSSILIQSGDNTDETAQIGFNFSHNATVPIDGDINIYAKNNLLLFARDDVNDGDDRKELQIGHGGNTPGVNADASGDITLNVGGILVGFAGRRDSYLQIGHGGWNIEGNMSGDISVQAALINLEAGSWDDAWVQVGHGGQNVRGHHSGDITVAATQGNLTMRGGYVEANGTEPARSYAMIGHGGINSDGNLVATIAEANQYTSMIDDANGDLVLTREDNVIAQRRDASGNLLYLDDMGNITTTVTATPLLAGHRGDITVTAAGSVTMNAGAGTDGFAMIGHGGRLTMGAHSGDIVVNAANGNVIFDRYISSSFTNRGARAFSKIGHGGSESSGGSTGDISVNAAGRIEFYAGRSSSFAQIGHGGRDEDLNNNNALQDFAQGTQSGDITVTAGSDIKFRGGFGSSGSTSFAQIGHGGFEVFAMPDEGHNGDITVTSTAGKIDFYAGQDPTEGLRPGQDPNATVAGWGANAADVATGGYEGNLDISYVMIGHGGHTSRGDHYGDITVSAATDIRIQGTGGYDGVGFINAIANGSPTTQNDDVRYGDPVYNTTANDSQSGAANFAQIGHGGYDSDHQSGASGSVAIGFGNKRDASGALTGEGSDITVTAGGDVRVIAAQLATIGPIGHQVNITTTNFDDGANLRSVTRADGTVWYLPAPVQFAQSSYALIGHGGRSSEMATDGLGHNGDITVHAGGDIEVIASDFERGLETGVDGFPSIWLPSPITNAAGQPIYYDGMGGYTTDPFAGTDIIPGGRGSAVTQFNFAQIGHGGYDTGMGNITGDIEVISTGGGLTMKGGKADRAYAQIGHGGNEEDTNLLRTGEFNGNILVDVNGPISMTAGTYSLAYTQIGHGGSNYNADATSGFVQDIVGNIEVYARNGDITVNGGAFGARDVDTNNNIRQGDGRFAIIGHGGWNGDMNAFGDITVEASTGSITLKSGVGRGDFTQIGHGGFSFDGGANNVLKSYSGDITVDAAGDIALFGGVGASVADFATVLDNNGLQVFPVNFSPANYANDLASHSQIGHGGGQMGASNGRGIEMTGDIRINTNLAGNNIMVIGGDGDLAHALIGHGGNRLESTPSLSGDIIVNAANSILLQGGERFMNTGIVAGGAMAYNSTNFAQIGLAIGADAGNRVGNTTGNVTVTAGNDIFLLAGGGVGAHAVIGNAASSYGASLENASYVKHVGDHRGDIKVVAGGDLFMRGADQAMADAGNSANAGDFADRPGGFSSMAQIGNGGAGVNSASSGHLGTIDVLVGGNLYMTSGDAVNAYAKIGHGDYMYTLPAQSGTGFRGGDVSVSVGESAYIEGGMIGHADPSLSTAIVLAGNTYVGVARNPSSNGILSITDSPSGTHSSLTSAFTGSLRFYMISHDYNFMTSGAMLNGSFYQPHTTDFRDDDENIANEFLFPVTGLPSGSYTPNGVYNPNLSKGAYVVYYEDGRIIVNPNPGGGGNGGGGPSGPRGPINPRDPNEALAAQLGGIFGRQPFKYENYDRPMELIGERPNTILVDRGLWTVDQLGEVYAVTTYKRKYLKDGQIDPEGDTAPSTTPPLTEEEGVIRVADGPSPVPAMMDPFASIEGASEGDLFVEVMLP